MSAASRPWWASGDDGPDPSEDPLGAHRAARRGRRPGGQDEQDEQPTAGSDPAEHGPDVCGVCPLCTGLRTLQGSHPELVAHLTEAARHLSAAVRTVLGEFATATSTGPDERDDGPLEHIDLD